MSHRLCVGPSSVKSLVAALAVLLGACGGSAATRHPYAAEMEAARKAASSDFERAVLEDGVVERAEYDEAFSRLRECLSGRGVTNVEYLLNTGGFYDSVATGEFSDETIDSCAEGNTTLIEPLYVTSVQNPDNRPVTDILAECFNRHGVGTGELSGEDVAAFFATNQPPAGVDATSPGYRLCLENPSL